jgi:hypothetical protein
MKTVAPVALILKPKHRKLVAKISIVHSSHLDDIQNRKKMRPQQTPLLQNHKRNFPKVKVWASLLGL